ncbi:hypothetical protein GRX03_06480 [Halovenus sp. WSH3]|uniref:Uncharacterized protein n=1 Tax=Halovenus carboxidivorans TaxID=2692199 RepID=A0A6B0TDH6_9EURY|nr:hypothetical protein [Halovenus carboxidivorans]MXR51249.1 hypothetical protein [Halovenus carboxidivorans]
MNDRRRFRTGIGGLCLGNGLLAVGFVFDQSLPGIVRLAVVAGATLGVVGPVIILYASLSDSEQFGFAGSGVKRRAPTGVLVSGLLTVVAGSLNLARVLVG